MSPPQCLLAGFALSSIVVVLLLLPVVYSSSVNEGGTIGPGSTMIISDMPYYEPFEDWDDCYIQGACYENQCNGQFPGGWGTPLYTLAQFTSMNWDWWVINGTTMSNRNFTTSESFPCTEVQTGPCVDHTTGTSAGKYIYAEATGCFGGQVFTATPYMTFTNSTAFLQFYYFMYGADMTGGGGMLEVTMSIVNESLAVMSTVSLWSEPGQQQSSPSDDWIIQNISLSTYFTQKPSASNPVTVFFTFNATIAGDRSPGENTWRSDIAIDDVMVVQGEFPSTTPKPFNDISPTPSATSSPIVYTSPAVISGGGGLSGAELGGIIGGVVGGLAALLLVLTILLIILLLIISPKKPPTRLVQDVAPLP